MKFSEKRLASLSPVVAELLRSYMLTNISRTANNIKADIGATRAMIKEHGDLENGNLDNKRREIIKEGKTALQKIQEAENGAAAPEVEAEKGAAAPEVVILSTLKKGGKGKGKAVQATA